MTMMMMVMIVLMLMMILTFVTVIVVSLMISFVIMRHIPTYISLIPHIYSSKTLRTSSFVTIQINPYIYIFINMMCIDTYIHIYINMMCR